MPAGPRAETPDALSAALRETIVAAIDAAGGALPFDRFMDLALYAPGLGYYVAGAPKLGPGGDFVTAPERSPLFGHCVAAQCAEVLAQCREGGILELGAGSGALAAQVLEALDALGAAPATYAILELSPDFQARQRERLCQLPPRLYQRCVWRSDLPRRWHGLVLANEVLDAMPVHRFRIDDAGRPEEVFVAARAGQLLETTGPIRSPGLAAAVAALQARGLARAPGYVSEINLRLPGWLDALAAALERAMALLIDYGYPRAFYYHPDRAQGTLMCHARHRAHADPYRDLGLQDITAHVDFSAAAASATAAGLHLAGFTTQAHFLLGCGAAAWLADRPDDLDAIQAAKQLLLPSAMGERFQAMALTVGLSAPPDGWRGFGVRDLRERL